MPRFLVTGATGFIGKHIVPALRERGDVTLLVRETGEPPFSGVRVVHGDVTRPETLSAAAAEADVILHMAAVSFVPDAVRDPVGAFAVNATGTVNLLEAARASRSLRRFVFLSTGHVYGPAQYSPIDEEHPLRPNGPYGASKLAAESMVAAYHAAYGLPTTVLRTFNVYGPGQSERFLVPTIIQQLASGAAPKLGDGRPVRDFTYVGDFVDLLLRATEAPEAIGKALNVGSGRGASVAEVARLLMDIAGVKGEPTFQEAQHREGEIMELVVDNRRAREVLGWSPNVTLGAGLEATWRAEANRQDAKV